MSQKKTTITRTLDEASKVLKENEVQQEKSEDNFVECVVFPNKVWEQFAQNALKNLNGQTTVTIQRILIPAMKIKKVDLSD